MTTLEAGGAPGEAQNYTAPKEFSHKAVLVTGVSRPNGMGWGIAKLFAENGADLLLSSTQNSADLGKEREADLRAEGVNATWIGADLKNEKEARDLINSVKDVYGKIDVLVSNAGITKNKVYPRMTTQMWDDVINTNLRPAYLLTNEAYSVFDKDEGGAIVLIASVIGKYGLGGAENYAAAKAGLGGLNKALAQDLGRRNIRSNMILPGVVETDMSDDVDEWSREMTIDATPLGRLARVRDVAELALFLASPRAAMITGQEIEVDGGLAGGGNAILALRREKYAKPPKK